MRILITGSSGMVGSALTHALAVEHEVIPLVRNKDQKGIFWDPAKEILPSETIEGFDAAIHLAGVNIAAKRWTSALKKEIRDSRIDTTRLLVNTFEHLKKKPKILITASAVGAYGSVGDQLLTEEHPYGRGFVADLVKDWENEALNAQKLGIRVACTRFGIIFNQTEGALAKILPAFKLGSGGIIGDGRQFMSWIHLTDVVQSLLFVLFHKELFGPINCTSPNPVTNQEFSSTLADILHKKARAHMPAFAARMLFGEMADQLLLSSCRAIPKKLMDAGFTFQFPELEGALRQLLKC